MSASRARARLLGVAAAVALVALLVVLDMLSFVQLAMYSQHRKYLRDASRLYARDLERYDRCNAQDRQAVRDCLVDVAPQIQTASVAMVVANRASIIYTQNPEDLALRDAALSAVKSGRAALQTEPLALLRALDAAECDSVVLNAALGGKRSPCDHRLRYMLTVSDALDRAELTVAAPHVAKQQHDLRQKAQFFKAAS